MIPSPPTQTKFSFIVTLSNYTMRKHYSITYLKNINSVMCTHVQTEMILASLW